MDADASILLDQDTSGNWRVAYQLSRPLKEIDLGPSIGDYRIRNWKPQAEGVRLLQKRGRDFILPAASRNEFSSAIFVVSPEPIDLRKDYEPFMPMGDGGMLLYSGHFIPFNGEGERRNAKLTVTPSDGARVSAFGETAQRLENWESPYKHPAFIYVGRAAPSESAAMSAITDTTAPAWILSELATFAPQIGNSLQELMQRALPTKPNIFVAMGDLTEAGRLSYSGDALPGQYQMTLAGGAWTKSSPEALAVLRRTTAHEAAHLWQAAARPRSNAVPNWIHEGGADALAAEAMVKAAYWTKADFDADFARARSRCGELLKQVSLERAEAAERWDAVYACGHVINVAAAGKAGAASFWREFVARTARDGYDEAAFLDLAEERSGQETAKAIRDLVRINDARPDLAISRMLK